MNKYQLIQEITKIYKGYMDGKDAVTDAVDEAAKLVDEYTAEQIEAAKPTEEECFNQATEEFAVMFNPAFVDMNDIPIPNEWTFYENDLKRLIKFCLNKKQ